MNENVRKMRGGIRHHSRSPLLRQKNDLVGADVGYQSDEEREQLGVVLGVSLWVVNRFVDFICEINEFVTREKATAQPIDIATGKSCAGLCPIGP